LGDWGGRRTPLTPEAARIASNSWVNRGIPVVDQEPFVARKAVGCIR